MRVDGVGLQGAQRILLHGVTGSGKTTLAARLGELTGLPWFEADSLTWQPGWVQFPEADPAMPPVRRFRSPAALDEWLTTVSAEQHERSR